MLPCGDYAAGQLWAAGENGVMASSPVLACQDGQYLVNGRCPRHVPRQWISMSAKLSCCS